MYLTHFKATNIKCFDDVELTFPQQADGSRAGWNVLLGMNATGKTTLLQAITIGLIGETAGMRLIAASPASWVRRGAKYGTFEVKFVKGDRDTAIGQPRSGEYHARFIVTGNESIEFEGRDYTSPQIDLHSSNEKALSGLRKGPYATDKSGWLVSGFGSFRRFTGGSDHDLAYDNGKVGRVASLFRETVALERSIKFLSKLYGRSQDKKLTKDKQKEANDEYALIGGIVNQLLPEGVEFSHADTESAYFRAPNASSVELLELSDGYRSFLSLVLELFRQISDGMGGVTTFAAKDPADGKWRISIEGIVLIDEADLRLHPSWQREFGPRLRAVFPRMQFIVSSHSPFIAQEATPNGLFVLQSSDDPNVRCIKPLPRVDGWTVDEILRSRLFGLASTRSAETEQLLKEHAVLRGAEKSGTPTRKQLERLESIEKSLAEQMTSPDDVYRRELDAKIRAAAAKAGRHA